MGRSEMRVVVKLVVVLATIFALQWQITAEKYLSQHKLKSHILQDSIIKKINENPNAGWKADRNSRFSNTTVGEFRRLLGVKPLPHRELQQTPDIYLISYLYDALILCFSFIWWRITSHPDQGHCGSCWAFGAVESLSDRFCVHFGVNISLSVNDLLSCCGFLCGSGCNGGYPIFAWRYLMHHGVVTEECDPYFDTTGCSHPGCEPGYPTPKCVRKCVKGNQMWRASKHYSVSAYRVHSDPHDIMAEVYKNGPVEVSYTVYEDFAHYKSGVYKHVTGDALGGHAVKLIGWGTTVDGEDYWLVANQWNRSWGDDGYFKIRRGTNECGIEGDVVAGLPSTKNLVREFVSDDFEDAVM
ncbi:hypothetical protein MLD38_002982 [Melastoma candidum]|uniref:Uncharacterized protein n=1 Tax=Melastoma candidum TaxID=119954 RepID=A0ACB9S338_9MYRT|nr:hypothetical protein MLD38_002982 [Melastoma candidum]